MAPQVVWSQFGLGWNGPQKTWPDIDLARTCPGHIWSGPNLKNPTATHLSLFF